MKPSNTSPQRAQLLAEARTHREEAMRLRAMAQEAETRALAADNLLCGLDPSVEELTEILVRTFMVDDPESEA